MYNGLDEDPITSKKTVLLVGAKAILSAVLPTATFPVDSPHCRESRPKLSVYERLWDINNKVGTFHSDPISVTDLLGSGRVPCLHTASVRPRPETWTSTAGAGPLAWKSGRARQGYLCVPCYPTSFMHACNNCDAIHHCLLPAGSSSYLPIRKHRTSYYHLPTGSRACTVPLFTGAMPTWVAEVRKLSRDRN